jgi:hypothetical protein
MPRRIHVVATQVSSIKKYEVGIILLAVNSHLGDFGAELSRGSLILRLVGGGRWVVVMIFELEHRLLTYLTLSSHKPQKPCSAPGSSLASLPPSAPPRSAVSIVDEFMAGCTGVVAVEKSPRESEREINSLSGWSASVV